MTGTFSQIDYRLRPKKHAERTMLIDLLRNIRYSPITDYQYVGFGSVAFVDFRMMHRHLGIQRMISIEDATTVQDRVRFRRNKPLGCIDLRFGNSNAILPGLDFSSPSAVWLDYDGALSRNMANDLLTIAQTAASGTFVAVTLTLNFAQNADATHPEYIRLTEEFDEFVDDTVRPLTFINADRHAEFARTVLGGFFTQALKNADAGQPDADRKREMRQVCNFRYSDGAAMVTFGWVVTAPVDAERYNDCRFEALSFFRSGPDPFRIRTPLVTPFEIREMERRITDVTNPKQLQWLPMKERRAFVQMHRYLPSYGNVEPV